MTEKCPNCERPACSLHLCPVHLDDDLGCTCCGVCARSCELLRTYIVEHSAGVRSQGETLEIDWADLVHDRHQPISKNAGIAWTRDQPTM